MAISRAAYSGVCSHLAQGYIFSFDPFRMLKIDENQIGNVGSVGSSDYLGATTNIHSHEHSLLLGCVVR